VDSNQDPASLQAAQAVLADVTDAAASVDAAKDVIDGTSNQGETFTLTAGIDSFVGATGNDVFNATESTGNRVLGTLDLIDGGAGDDTLNVSTTDVAAFTFGGAT